MEETDWPVSEPNFPLIGLFLLQLQLPIKSGLQPLIRLGENLMTERVKSKATIRT